jgi:N6-adenosine-specific RNA methylase IME4
MTEPFRVISADPPWPFGDKLPGSGRGAGKHYNLLSLEGIKDFPLPPIADDAVLFLWRVASMSEEAHAVERSWGFTHKAEIVWEKQSVCSKCKGAGERFNPTRPCEQCGGVGRNRWFGMGRITRAAHEVCLVATRGRPKVLDRSVRSLFSAVVPRGRHSAKPPEFYAMVERLFAGPYCELFAVERRPGWHQEGFQLGEETA